MIDPVERRCQVRVEHPPPSRARAIAALGCLEDSLDRVMAAAAGPEAIRPRLEPRLPLWLQRIGRPRLLRAVGDDRDGRFILPLLQPRVGMFRVDADLCGQAVR